MPPLTPSTNGKADRPLFDLLRVAAAKMCPESAVPGGEEEHSQAEQDSRVSRDFSGYAGIVGDVASFLADYIALPEASIVAIVAWVLAAWLMDTWDKFPHLCLFSPEKRCGKTLLLLLLSLIVPRPRASTNISPAALFRVIDAERPTLLLDEAQSLARRGSEASEVTREILNAGIDKGARVTRCAGANRDEIQEFCVFSPKVFAMIGHLDGVLVDRSLSVPMKRKTAADQVRRFRSRTVEPIGNAVREKVQEWAHDNGERVAEIYGRIEPFPIDNDRMAELLMPLQAVLEAAGAARALKVLEQYATGLDDRDREQEAQSPGVRLLAACRDIFGAKYSFYPTVTLIKELLKRTEEPWHRWNRGQPITDEALANLLRPYGIRPARNKAQTARGYFAADFKESWERYLPALPQKIPATTANPSSPASRDSQDRQARRVFQGMKRRSDHDVS
jgi:hypothetical protein